MNPFEMPPLFCQGKLLGCTNTLRRRSNGATSSDVHHLLLRSLCDRRMCCVHAGDDEFCCVADCRDTIHFIVRGLHSRCIKLLLTSYMRAGDWSGETAISCLSLCFRSVHLLSPSPSYCPFTQFSPQMIFTAMLVIPYGVLIVLPTSCRCSHTQGTILGIRRHTHDPHYAMFLHVCSSSPPPVQSALGATRPFQAHRLTVLFSVC